MKIVVIGCGIGGIVSSIILARNNHDVVIYEKKSYEDVGYDWTDVFSSASLIQMGFDDLVKKAG
jgi:2-polyprenyl-6-methoxyphenol hydroxylase-like FAD-dependent oxidoreductase